MMHQLFYTRMMGLWNLSILHTLLRRAIPECWDSGNCQLCTRRC